MDYDNYGKYKKSRLPPPSTKIAKIPENIMLSDLSESVQNARSTTAGIARIGEKRKTLAESAVEYDRPAPPAPSSKLPNATLKSGLIPTISRYASSTTASSVTRSTSAASSRNTSNGSNFSQSLGPGRTQSLKPGSSMYSYQQMSRTSRAGHHPASSLDASLESSLETKGANINSMKQFSSTQTTTPIQKPSKQHIVNPFMQNVQSTITKPLYVAKRPMNRGQTLREISISTHMSHLSLNDDQCLRNKENVVRNIGETSRRPKTPPSQIPRRKKRESLAFATPTPSNRTASPTKSVRTMAPPAGRFLTIDSNVKCADFDVNDRLETIETMYANLKATVEETSGERDNIKETIALLKARNSELELETADLKRARVDLQRTIDEERGTNLSMKLAMEELTRKQLIEASSLKQAMDDQRRAHNIEIDDLSRQKRRELEDLRSDHEETQKKRERVHREEMNDERKRLEDRIESEKEQRRKELHVLTSEGTADRQRIENQLLEKDKDLKQLEDLLEKSKLETAFAKEQITNLTSKLSEVSTTVISLESSLRSSKARVEFLESDNKSQSQAFADLEQRTQDAIRESDEAKAKLRTEETLRRKLHNQVQELKGNIRVYCRVRPALNSDAADQARITFPDQQEDAKEIDVLGPEEKSSLGKISTKNHAFSFDRVFSPTAQNTEIFDELSQLVQSALDGYNVCIFCYGQTGSGKTHTMSSVDGMIPKAVNQIYDTAKSLEEKGWNYSMEGSFVEIYNENINDLLGKAEDFDNKKHEIRHDPINLKTTITDVQTMKLDSPDRVQQVLARAMNNRSVAATLANARSSRSHSVFILKLIGENAITGEKSEGTLNLVDLAGSERLSHSGATGDRLKETQNINKSLSCLGDVIGALGQGKDGGHIPYRNSKLTYLLQYSLGGNSKTLMFVMISPLQAHLSETLTSLKFATKVNNTKIGTAKKQSKA